MADLIRITSSVLPANVKVVALRGREAISSPYQFEVFVSVPRPVDGEIDLADAVGAKAVVSIPAMKGTGVVAEPTPFHFAGIFAAFDLVEEDERRSLIRAVLVPRLWELGLSVHSRIFTKQSPLDVIRSVLRDAGLADGDVEVRVENGEPEEHITQYRESDLAFISRWMEREGIYYFFEHTPRGEKLVLASGKTYPTELLATPVPYVPSSGDDFTRQDALRSFTARNALLPSQVRVRDYDYGNPQLEVAGSAPVAQHGSAEVSLYGERFFSPGAGKRLAQTRAEELRCRSAVFQAKGQRLHLRAGYAFELEHHPRASLNGKYLVVESHHRASQEGASGWLADEGFKENETYSVQLTAISADTQYRPERVTPWPRIDGYENGTVEGPGSSEYAQIDDQGRYLLKMRFDEGSGRGSRASTYVRMMQPHGGAVEGFHFPLRKDTEVVVSFLGGDPDRPVISGVVPNALTPSPVTSGNHTKNVIQTGGHNRIELEDLAGQQRITMSTPYANTYLRMGAPNDDHECILRTDENGLMQTDINYDVRVGSKMDVLVGNTYNTTVTTGPCTVDVMAGPYKVHAHAALIDLIANADFRLESESSHGNIQTSTFLHIQTGSYGKWETESDVTVRSNTADAILQGALAFEVLALGSTGTVRSNGKLTLHSETAEAELHAATDIAITSDDAGIEITAPNDINITSTGGKVNCSSGGEAKFNWGGDVFTVSNSSSNTLTYGASKSIKFAIEDNMAFSLSRDITLGASMSLKIAASLDIEASMAIKMTVFKAELEGVKATVEATKAEGTGTRMGAVATWMKAHGFEGNVGALKVEA